MSMSLLLDIVAVNKSLRLVSFPIGEVPFRCLLDDFCHVIAELSLITGDWTLHIGVVAVNLPLSTLHS